MNDNNIKTSVIKFYTTHNLKMKSEHFFTLKYLMRNRNIFINSIYAIKNYTQHTDYYNFNLRLIYIENIAIKSNYFFLIFIIIYGSGILKFQLQDWCLLLIAHILKNII